MRDLVKVHVWLKNIGDLPSMERLFAEHFPTTSCLLMFDGIAYRSDGDH